ncbi:MAG: hypothetical protein IJ593_08530 [Lachnospiraceae bacterium]|nr:hypothetical protein [Lachnospiraceae bacterium]
MVNTNNKVVYCHFSFRRPKDKSYGIFSVAFYRDFEGKKIITHKTSKIELWENHQFITAIQSYAYALKSIYEFQGLMKSANISQVMLVTDNGTLAGWISDPNKNKAYTKYMNRAVEPYKVGAAKEIVLGVGLCEPRKSEKSYKFCKEENVENDYTTANNTENTHKINIDSNNYKSIIDIIEEDKSIPDIKGIREI